MQQEHPQIPVKSLLILNIIATLFSMGVVATLIIQGYTGFGTVYNSSTTCNLYLAAKYEIQREVRFKVNFLEAIIAMVCLVVEMILNTKSFLQVRKIQQQKSAQIIRWTQKDLNLKYICQSLAILDLLPIFAFYLSIIIQEGGCFHSVQTRWIILMLESVVSLLLTIICWIILLRYSVSRVEDVGLTNFETNIQMNEIRQKQAEMKNIFEMEGSELYKTIKRQNRDATEPLLIQNRPIPLFPNQVDKSSNKQQAVRFINEMNDEQNPIRSQRMNSNSIPIPLLNERKKSPSKLSSSAMTKSKLSAMIEKKKNKFREINPLKQSANKYKIEEEKDEQEIIIQNRMKNLPKPYSQYIKQAKKPKRNPPNFDIILQNYNKEEKERLDTLLAQEEKPFLKKYRKDQQEKKVEKNENNQQIQFIDEQLEVNMVSQMIEQKQEIKKPENQPELFFHKPRNDKNLKKRRKILFQQDIIDTSKLNQKDQKQLIINKLKNNKPKQVQLIPEVLKSPRKKNIQSKQDIMLRFLKSKYSTPEQGSGNQAQE